MTTLCINYLPVQLYKKDYFNFLVPVIELGHFPGVWDAITINTLQGDLPSQLLMGYHRATESEAQEINILRSAN